ncbi:hypothetical protein OE88DRAFT_36368 [Heliocybe sulcata]|uniref:Uncharacterized protein n=1 Tax=Heliocybe sulcata TaxID=5364 RepID=A0A5C3NJC8_9AGAM|nr:hypothetical protein OE88DRAFT_36368 [Heliocybe sulcata]
MAPGGPSPQSRYEVWSPNLHGSNRPDSTGIDDEDLYDAIYPEDDPVQAGPSASQPSGSSMSTAHSSTTPPSRDFPSLLRASNDPAFSPDPYSNPYYSSGHKEKAKADKKSAEKKRGVGPHVTNEDPDDRMEDGDMVGLDPPPAYSPSASTSSTTPSMTSTSSLALSEPYSVITPPQSQSRLSVVTDSTSSDLARLTISPHADHRHASAPELHQPVERPAFVESPSMPDTREHARSDEGHGAARRKTQSPKRKAHPQALDRIDELDGTNPLGIALHNEGPYDAINRKLVGGAHGAAHHRGGAGKSREDPSAQMSRGPRHPALQPTSYAVGQIVPKGFTGQPAMNEFNDPNAFHMYPGHRVPSRPSTMAVPPSPVYPSHPNGRGPYPAHYSMPNPPANFEPESVPPVPKFDQRRSAPGSRHHDGRLHKSRPPPPQSVPPDMKPAPHHAPNAPLRQPPPGVNPAVPPTPVSQRVPLQPLPPQSQHLLAPPPNNMTPLPSPPLPNPHPEPVVHPHHPSYRVPPVPQAVPNIRGPPPPPDIFLPPGAAAQAPPPLAHMPSTQTQNRAPQPQDLGPRPAPHYLPKRLVMPSPLQNQPPPPPPQRAHPAAPLYLDKYRPFQPEVQKRAQAQAVPMHRGEQPKLVKKRNTIGGAAEERGYAGGREREREHRRGTSWFGMRRTTSVQEEKPARFGRRLSKRK